jgi:hypothetical protein
LTAGNWKIAMLTYGWEDYAKHDAYPGNNGYLRGISGYSGTYTPGVGAQANVSLSRKVMDFVSSDPTAQSNIMVSGIVDASQMISVNLP